MKQQEASSSTIMEMLRQEGQPILSYSDIASIGRRPQDLRVFLDEFTLFFNELNSRNFLYEFDEPVGKDDRRYIKHVFFTTHEALDTFKHFPEVVLFDTTYKTNVSRKPLGAFPCQPQVIDNWDGSVVTFEQTSKKAAQSAFLLLKSP